MKNSIIRVRGLDEEIYTSKTEAEKVNQIWENKQINPDFIINIANYSFPKKDIKLVVKKADSDSANNNNKDARLFYEEEKKNRENFLKLSPEKKARLLDMFFYLYKIATLKEPTEEVLNQAYEIQLDFFKKNPKRTLCDLYLLKKIIPRLENPRLQWQNYLREGYLIFIEKTVYRDMQLSGQLQSPYYPKTKELSENPTIEEMKSTALQNRNQENKFNDLVAEAVNNF